MISKNDLRYLKLAESMSKYSDYPRIHIGACVVKRKSIISIGCNRNRTHPEQQKYNQLLQYTIEAHRLHAEMDALIKAGDESKNSTLYVFRMGKDGVYRDCKPCRACMGKIFDSGIKRIVYTVFEGIKEMDVS